MVKWGWLRHRTSTHGVYELTDKGWDVLLESVPNLTLELVLASRLCFWGLSALGFRDRLVLRFSSGSIAAYHAAGAIEAGNGTIDLGLDLLSRWDDAEAVERHLDRVRPARVDADRDDD